MPKPHTATHGTVSPLVSWSVTLTANPEGLWPTQYTTMTAKANHTVSGTVYYIDIMNNETNEIYAACGAGTTCTVAITSQTPGLADYSAYISDSPTDVIGSHYVTYSGGEDVDWYGVDVALTASKTTVPMGNTVTLTEKSSADIGPTPFYIQLWDTTAGTLLTQCASGTTCSASVSQSAATVHTYVATFSYTPSSRGSNLIAFVASYDSALPPVNIQASSNAVHTTYERLA